VVAGDGEVAVRRPVEGFTCLTPRHGTYRRVADFDKWTRVAGGPDRFCSPTDRCRTPPADSILCWSP